MSSPSVPLCPRARGTRSRGGNPRWATPAPAGLARCHEKRNPSLSFSVLGGWSRNRSCLGSTKLLRVHSCLAPQLRRACLRPASGPLPACLLVAAPLPSRQQKLWSAEPPHNIRGHRVKCTCTVIWVRRARGKSQLPARAPQGSAATCARIFELPHRAARYPRQTVLTEGAAAARPPAQSLMLSPPPRAARCCLAHAALASCARAAALQSGRLPGLLVADKLLAPAPQLSEPLQRVMPDRARVAPAALRAPRCTHHPSGRSA